MTPRLAPSTTKIDWVTKSSFRLSYRSARDPAQGLASKHGANITVVRVANRKALPVIFSTSQDCATPCVMFPDADKT